MHDGLKIGPQLINFAVEGKFDGWPMGANNIAIGFDAHDVFGCQLAFVDARRGDPDVAIVVFDGKVATAEGVMPLW